MLKEITLREAVPLMENGDSVYGVNLERDERVLVDLSELLSGIRILADLPEEEPAEKKERRAGRPKGSRKEPTDEEIAGIAASIDGGKIKALREAKWAVAQIADEFGLPVPTMRRVMGVLGQK